MPPITVVGDKETVEIDAGLMVRFPLTVVEPTVAEIDAVVDVPTGVVVTVKVAVVAPEATVTVAGTVALELLEVRATLTPPAPAAVFKVTVPVDVFPPTTVEGESVTEVGTLLLRTLFTNPEKIIAPQPVAVSQPTVALDVAPPGTVPLFPVVTSKKTDASPL